VSVHVWVYMCECTCVSVGRKVEW